MVSHWSLSDSKSSQIYRTLLSILADLNNAVVWVVSICPLISKSFSPCPNPSATVSSAPITIGITVTFMSHSVFSSQARSRYLSLFSLSFSFTLWSTGTTKSTSRQVILIIIIIRTVLFPYPANSSLVFWCFLLFCISQKNSFCYRISDPFFIIQMQFY